MYYWQPYLNGLIQEIRKYDWFKLLLAYGICTEQYQYRIRNNHIGSKQCNSIVTLKFAFMSLN